MTINAHTGFLNFEVQVKQLRPIPGTGLPRKPMLRGSELAAGYDLHACIDEPVIIAKDGPAILMPTGIAIYTGTANLAIFLIPRSGLGHKQGLILGNSVGLVDGDYQNEIFISAWNRGQNALIQINPGDRIAQAVFLPIAHPTFHYVDEFETESERGLDGFGSTGV